MKRRTWSVLLTLSWLAVFATACAAGINTLAQTPDAGGVLAGFWRGLWHGLIAPVTFVISLFTQKVRLYEVHNNGGWYDFGFVVGLLASLGGPSARATRHARERF